MASRSDADDAAARVWSAVVGPVGAPLVVLVHGSMDRSAGLLRLGRRLAERYRVARFDRRGYGRSGAIGPPFAMGAQVDDLADVVERGAADGPVALFGHSYGGNVALALADRRPSMVGAVVVYESPLSWLDWWPQGSSGARALAVATDDGAAGDAAETFLRAVVGDERWERLPPAVRRARRAEGPAMVAELSDLRAAVPWRAERILAPVLALHGERARRHHRRAMRLVADSVAGARCCEIAGAGHAGPNTHPDDVAAAVISFLAARLDG